MFAIVDMLALPGMIFASRLNQVEQFRGRHDGDTCILAQAEQVAISRHNDLSMCRGSTSQNHVVVRIRQHSLPVS